MRHRDVTVVEVGPRDGLQNEPVPIPTEVKIAFIDALTRAGLPVIEVTSFVRPNAVPQLADAADVMHGITRNPAVRYPVLVPNEKGLARAAAAGATAIALFASATEEFAQANLGTSINGAFERFAPVVAAAASHGMWIRGYVSVAFGCPYSGDVSPAAVVAVAERLLALGCHEICFADTIGAASPGSVRAVLRASEPTLPVERLALHFHDTAGNAIANVATGLERGIRIFDGAAGGLGGCPFAPGAPGNLDTRRLIAFLEGQGLSTGVDLDEVNMALAHLAPFVPIRAQIAA